MAMVGTSRERRSNQDSVQHTMFHPRCIIFTLLGSLTCLVGCQDQSGATHGADDARDPHSLTARLLFSDSCRDLANPDAMIQELVTALNAERAKRKLTPLRLNDTLCQIADFYACRLIEGDFFAHIDPFDGSTVDRRASDFGYPFLKIGENLASGQRDALQTLTEWMNSPGHRVNILDHAYTEIGIGVKVGLRGEPVWVLELGRPITAGDLPASDSVPTSAPGSSTPTPAASQPG